MKGGTMLRTTKSLYNYVFMISAFSAWFCAIGAFVQNRFSLNDGVVLFCIALGIVLWIVYKRHDGSRILRIVRYTLMIPAIGGVCVAVYILITMILNINAVNKKIVIDPEKDRENNAFTQLVEVTRSPDIAYLNPIPQKLIGASVDTTVLQQTSVIRGRLFEILQIPIAMPVNAEFKIVGVSPNYTAIKKTVVAEILETELLFRAGDTMRAQNKLEILWKCTDALLQSRMEMFGMHTTHEILALLTDFIDLSPYARKAAQSAGIRKSIESTRKHVRSSFAHALEYETDLFIRILAEHDKGTLIFLEQDMYSYKKKYLYNYAGRWPFLDEVASARILMDNRDYILAMLDARLRGSSNENSAEKPVVEGRWFRNPFGEYLVVPLQDYRLFVSSAVRAQSRVDLLYTVLYEPKKITQTNDVLTGKPFEIVTEGTHRFAQTQYRAGENKTVPVKMRLSY